MIFIEKETAEIFEFLVISLQGTGYTNRVTGHALFTPGSFTLYNPTCANTPLNWSSFVMNFELLGFI